MLIRPQSQIHKSQAFISAEIFDPATKKLLEKFPLHPANTFLQAWMKVQEFIFTAGAIAPTGVIDTSGVAQTLSSNCMNMNAGSTVTTFGIVIGNQVSPTAVALTDTKLQAQVTTNVTHGAMSFSLNAPDGSHYQLLAQRQFTNLTGSTLLITEVAIYTQDGSSHRFCVDRTLYNISLGNTLATTITYTWNTNV